MFGFARKATQLLPAESTLPGRKEKMPVPAAHFVNGRPISPPFPEGLEQVQFGMGCFWGAERIFWQTRGVWTTAVGYSGGVTPNPTYEEVCSGRTNHTEAVLVVFDPRIISLEELFKVFWESHDPTQGMRQGNDTGSQYRSALYTYGEAQMKAAIATRDAFQQALDARKFGKITTEIRPAPEFFYAEDYHQQYFGRNPNGYCGLGGTGVTCPIGVLARA
ncbi:MAG: peptide-methionine (S)-S-oxide reductase MsrA [Proteobacteria bacterium]|nr:peptide-methionine (S)-S-oxide reductase MsrA [Pseudomonadota bacterium]